MTSGTRTQGTHNQLIISSEVSVVDIDVSPVMLEILGKKIIFHDQNGEIKQEREDVDTHGGRTQCR